MDYFKLVLSKSFARHKVYKAYRSNGRYLGYLTVWDDGYVGYSCDGNPNNLGWMREVAETYKSGKLAS